MPMLSLPVNAGAVGGLSRRICAPWRAGGSRRRARSHSSTSAAAPPNSSPSAHTQHIAHATLHVSMTPVAVWLENMVEFAHRIEVDNETRRLDVLEPVADARGPAPRDCRHRSRRAASAGCKVTACDAAADREGRRSDAHGRERWRRSSGAPHLQIVRDGSILLVKVNWEGFFIYF